MTENSSPSSWKPPEWHPDFGDPQIEFSMLQQFATKLAEAKPECSINLDCFEDGYMAVEISTGGMQVAEVQIVQGNADADSRSYVLFSENSEDEQYFDNTEMLLSAVKSLLQ